MISIEKRVEVYDMYGGRCAYCGFDLHVGGDNNDPFLATVDHIVPQVDGGTDDMNNLVPACKLCNHIKDHMSLDVFRSCIRLERIPNNHSKKIKADLMRMVHTRYKIMLGEYKGVLGYDWNNQFYFEKNAVDQKTTRYAVDRVKVGILSEMNTKIGTDDAEKLATKMLYKDRITKSEAKHIYERDDWRCSYCGCTLLGGVNTFGHDCASPSMLDESVGYTDENTVAACNICKMVKQRISLEEFRDIVFGRGLENSVLIAKLSGGPGPSRVNQATAMQKEKYDGFAAFGNRFYFELNEGAKRKIEHFWDARPMHNKDGDEMIKESVGMIGSGYRRKKTFEQEVAEELQFQEDMEKIDVGEQMELSDIVEESDLVKSDAVDSEVADLDAELSTEEAEKAADPDVTQEFTMASGVNSNSADETNMIDKVLQFVDEYKQLKAEQAMLRERLSDVQEKLQKYDAVMQTIAQNLK